MTTPRNPFVAGLFYGVDANGVPLASGKLYTYVAESTTPQATYPGPFMVLPNQNPVILNAGGLANVWLPAGLSYRFDLYDQNDVLVWTTDDWLSPAASSGNGVADTSGAMPGGRLSLATGPVWSDLNSLNTLYYVPYRSDKVPLYDGTSWALYSIGSYISQDVTDNTRSPAAVSPSHCYDAFVWNDSGTVRLSRGPAWSSTSARGSGAGTTELDYLNGRLINKYSITNGPGAQRGLYVGSIYADGSGQLNDGGALRHVWNNYNRVQKYMQAIETTNQWNYATATWRQANAAAGNQLDFVIGSAEDNVVGQVLVTFLNGTAVGGGSVAIGLDSTSSPIGLRGTAAGGIGDGDGYTTLTAVYESPISVGRHYLAWLEKGNGTGTQAWYGDNGGSDIQSGITGRIFC